MKVIILGGGQVGYSIARYLSTDDNEVTVVDCSSDVLHNMSDKLDIKPIQGFASYPEVLTRAQAHNADLLVAVTASDEVNMIACEIAHSLFSVKTKIARIRHQGYLKTRDVSHLSKNLSVDVIISPEMEVARSLARSVQIVGAFEVFALANDSIKIIAVHVPESTKLLNTPIRFINAQFIDIDLEIACIRRKDNIFFPTEDDILKTGDDVYFAVRSQDVHDAMEIFGHNQLERRNLVIVGCGNIGLGLASEIENMGLNIKVKIIEKNTARCTEAARSLRFADIINGDALDIEVLADANIKNTETLLALTEDDKVNILVSLLAKQQGAGRTVSLLNKTNYSGLVTSLGVDAIVNPRVITVSTILQYVCQGRLRAVHSIADGFAEIIEAEVKETSLIIGLTVEDITIRGVLQVISIMRDNEVVLKPINIIISAEDILVIMVHKDGARKAEKLFHERPSYL